MPIIEVLYNFLYVWNCMDLCGKNFFIYGNCMVRSFGQPGCPESAKKLFLACLLKVAPQKSVQQQGLFSDLRELGKSTWWI